MRRPWTANDDKTLRQLRSEGLRVNEVARRMGRDHAVIQSRASKAGIPFEPRSRKWTATETAELCERYPNTPSQVLADSLGIDLQKLYQKAQRLGLKKSESYLSGPHACRLRRGDNIGAAFRFRKGSIPANKGLRRPGWTAGRMAETQFKKGQRGNKWVPTGSIRLSPDGYWEQKIHDTPQSYKNWRGLHILLWEEHLGPLPPGHCICFKNGNRDDIRIDNLACISRAERMRRNSIHRYSPELRQAMLLVGKVKQQLRKRNEKQDRGPSKSSVRRARRPTRSGQEVRSRKNTSRRIGQPDDHQLG